MHWHSYGEILLVGGGETNIYKVNQNTYQLSEGDFVLVWPMEMHEILDADREKALVIQFSNSFISSLLDLQRLMHFYRNLHVIERKKHPELSAKLQTIAYRMKDIFLSETDNRELRCMMLLMEFILTLDEHRAEFSSELSVGVRSNFNDDVMQRMIMVTDYIKSNLTAEDLSQQGRYQQGLFFEDFQERHRHELQQVAEHDPPRKGHRASCREGHSADAGRDAVGLPQHIEFQPRLLR